MLPDSPSIPTLWTTFSGHAPQHRSLGRVTTIRSALACTNAHWRSIPILSTRRAGLSSTLAGRVLDNMSDSPAAGIARAETLVGQALAASPRSPLAHYAKGQVLRAQRRNEEAIPEYEMVIAFNRNWPTAYAQLGRCKFYTASMEEMIPLVEQAIRLSPLDPEIHNWYSRIGLVHLLQSRTDEASLWFEKAHSANPALASFHAYLASAYALKGDIERASADLVEARRLSGDDRYSSFAHLTAVGDFGVPSVRGPVRSHLFFGLRRAGMPED